MKGSRSSVGTSMLRYFLDERSSTALHRRTNGVAWPFCERRADVGLPSCTTHAELQMRRAWSRQQRFK